MNKKLAKALNDANKKLKERKFLLNYKIVIHGDFMSEYNEIRLENKSGSCFPIANAETEGEAIAAISAYLSGFSHGREKSYVLLCDRDDY